MLKIRLRRMGAIRQPHFRIVVADARSPRDGRFIETLGHYNPITDPATIQVDVEKYEEWKRKGAQPTQAVASLVRQFNRRQRDAAASISEAGAAARPAARGGRKKPETPAPAEAAATTEVAAEADVTEMPGAMNEGMAEATRDGGEESEAIIGAAADTGGSANPGAAADAEVEGDSGETAPSADTGAETGEQS